MEYDSSLERPRVQYHHMRYVLCNAVGCSKKDMDQLHLSEICILGSVYQYCAAYILRSAN